MTRKIEWDDEWIATLVETTSGNYLAPPVVFDTNGDVVMGREVLDAVATSGTAIEHPMLHGYGPGDLAALEQKLAHIAQQLDVPLETL